VKQRLLAIGVLTGSALLAVSAIRLSRTIATIGEFGRVGQMLVTERPSKATSSQKADAETQSSMVATPAASVPVAVPDMRPRSLPAPTITEEPSPEPSAAEFAVASDPDDYELRAALKSALVDDLEFFELLDQNDPEIRAGVVEYLQQSSSQ
jgi:hypothetical protein